MLRLLLCVVIAAASLMTGIYFSAKLTRREHILSGYIRLLDRAGSRISYNSDSLCEAFSDNFAGVAFRADEPFAPQWESMLSDQRLWLKPDDAAAISAFADGLGTSDASSQLRHIEEYKIILAQRLRDAERDSGLKAQPYRVLPFAAGMVIVIMLI